MHKSLAWFSRRRDKIGAMVGHVGSGSFNLYTMGWALTHLFLFSLLKTRSNLYIYGLYITFEEFTVVVRSYLCLANNLIN